MRIFLITTFAFLSLHLSAQRNLPVSWDTKADVENTDTATIHLTATVKEGWVLYGMSEEAGPISTKIKYDVETIGENTANPAPVKEYDNLLEQEVLKHKGSTTFSQKVKFNKTSSTISVTYMACNKDACLPPYTEHINVNFK